MVEENIKKKLCSTLLVHLEQGIQETLRAIEMARESLFSETKSSMGDKYETGRAMVQIELEKSSNRLQNLRNLKKELSRVNPDKVNDRCETGSVVYTNHDVYFISIGSGKVELEGQTYFAISPGSPLGIRLRGMKPGDQFEFSGKSYRIENII